MVPEPEVGVAPPVPVAEVLARAAVVENQRNHKNKNEESARERPARWPSAQQPQYPSVDRHRRGGRGVILRSAVFLTGGVCFDAAS